MSPPQNQSATFRRLILVRHAAPDKRPGVAVRDWPLSSTGLADAERLAELLVPYAPAAILASDEMKARQTAQPLAERLGLGVEVVAGLREHERRTVGYLGDAAFQATMARFFAEPDALIFGEETARQALHRFTLAIVGALASHPDGDVAVFTHGTVLSLFVAARNATDPMDFWKRLSLPAWVVLAAPDFTLL
jgi:broad specificity phosphatase PhoE